MALRCVIRGETTHYEIVSQDFARTLTGMASVKGSALGNGLQTVENSDQAWACAQLAKTRVLSQHMSQLKW